MKTTEVGLSWLAEKSTRAAIRPPPKRQTINWISRGHADLLFDDVADYAEVRRQDRLAADRPRLVLAGGKSVLEVERANVRGPILHDAPQGPQAGLMSLAVSPDGSVVAGVAADGTLWAWSNSGVRGLYDPPRQYRPRAVEFLDDQRLAIRTVSDRYRSKSVCVLDLKQARVCEQYIVPRERDSYIGWETAEEAFAHRVSQAVRERAQFGALFVQFGRGKENRSGNLKGLDRWPDQLEVASDQRRAYTLAFVDQNYALIAPRAEDCGKGPHARDHPGILDRALARREAHPRWSR